MATLAERLAEDDVADLPDWQAADVLNTPSEEYGTTRRDVLTRSVYEYLLGTGEWGLIELYSRTMPTGTKLSAQGTGGTITSQDQRAAALITFVRAIQTFDVIRATDAAISQQLATILDGMVTFAFLTEDSRDAIIDMATRYRSWAEANGYPNGVTARDVGLARGGK